jgi:protein-tyrosine phosphatase
LTDPEDPLTPYDTRLQELASEIGVEVRYTRLSIKDRDVPTTERMAEILDTIREEIDAGRPVYFHCWGGLGRSGTVACCWLLEDEKLSCEDVFVKIGELRRHTPDAIFDSPHTDTQRAFVRAWEPR